MKRISISLLVLSVFLFQIQAQLTVADNNNVGIGVTAPVSKLSIGNVGAANSTLYVENSTASSSYRAAQFYKSTSGGTWAMGLTSGALVTGGASMLASINVQTYNSTPLTSKRTFGVRATVGNATSGYNYAVYGYLAGSNNGAAIFGATPGKLDCNTGGVYAGYFRGNVYVENTLFYTTLTQNSDINLKKDIRLLKEEETKQMEKLNTLDGIIYKLKSPADLGEIDPLVADTIKIDPRTLVYDEPKYTDDMIGLSAQDVQKVYPELVTVDGDGYLSLNYIGLIPVLIEALKEQDAILKEQNATMLLQADELALLREEIEKLKNSESTEETTKQ